MSSVIDTHRDWKLHEVKYKMTTPVSLSTVLSGILKFLCAYCTVVIDLFGAKKPPLEEEDRGRPRPRRSGTNDVKTCFFVFRPKPISAHRSGNAASLESVVIQ